VGTHETTGRVRYWGEDPLLEVLLQRATEESWDIPKVEEWLRESMYGEILYKYHRCGWLHDGIASDKLAPLYSDEEGAEPQYQNLLVPEQPIDLEGSEGPSVRISAHRDRQDRSIVIKRIGAS
jgi:hypothetical protein